MATAENIQTSKTFTVVNQHSILFTIGY